MPGLTPALLASPDVLARARKIKLFLMDVDGTLTDGYRPRTHVRIRCPRGVHARGDENILMT